MNPDSWREMVDRTRELELALGNPIKKIENNEKESIIVQRRSIRTKKDLFKGDLVNQEDLEVLRPCPKDALPIYKLNNIIGMKLKNDIKKGDYLKNKDFKNV